MTNAAPPILIRPLAADEWQAYRDLRLRSLAESPDAFCATLADEQQRSPDNWAARVAAAAVSGHDRPVVAERAGALLGLVWAKTDGDDPGAVNLFQMWVAPEGRGLGVGAQLLAHAVEWARARGAARVQLGVFDSAVAALHLYRRAGFVPDPADNHVPDDGARRTRNMRLDFNAGTGGGRGTA